MKFEHWIILGVGILVIYLMKTGVLFTGLTSQRGVFGTASTPVDSSVCCS
jgi:hypothetical protein